MTGVQTCALPIYVDSTILRVVSDTMPKELNVESTSARFEDVYMFYFDLENAKEV